MSNFLIQKRLQLTKSTFPDAALDLADRLELNPLTAVIHQYRGIGGDETMLTTQSVHA